MLIKNKNNPTDEIDNYILAKAFGIPNNDFFLDLIKGVPKDIRYQHNVEKTLKENFHPYFRISFSDNDFADEIFQACDDFYIQFKNKEAEPNFYNLYKELKDNNIKIEVFMKNYIVQKAYSYYLGKLYDCIIDIHLTPKAIDEHTFNYLSNLIKIEKVKYLPDELTIIKKEEIFKQVGKKYLYTPTCWNSEDCFISMDDFEGGAFLI